MSDRHEFVYAQVDRVLAVAAEMPAETLRVLGRALHLSGGRLAKLGGDLWIWALNDDFPEEAWLVRMQLSGRLGELAGDDELLERLEDAEEPLWIAVRQALLAVRSWPPEYQPRIHEVRG
jgi:hypothetical protein